MQKQPLLSIIIPCFNAEKYIAGCLDSVLVSKYKDFEVIVIDDASKDKSRRILKKYQGFPHLKVIFLKKSQGPAKARNLGAEKSLGKYLFFLDVDTETEKNCLMEVVKKLESDQKVGAIQVKLLKGKTNKIDAAGHFLSSFGFPYEIGVNENESQHNQEKIIFGARSAGLGIRKNLFKKIQGFDEDYLIYGEDTDLSWRVWLAGNKVLYLPQARIYHFAKSSLGIKTSYRIFYEGAKNSTGNILKNAPAKILVWMLPLHLLGWLFVSLKLIFQKRFKLAGWIYRGLGWNLKNLNKIWEKRKKINQFKKRNLQSKIIFGKISTLVLIQKGWKWLKNL